WRAEKRAHNVPISDPILLQKAEDLTKELKVENFATTSVWLSCCKVRNQILCKKAHGESADAYIAAAENWITNQFLDIVMGYEPDCIYNCDKSGIFYCAIPDRILAFKDKKLSSSKKSKERLTILFCCNTTGKHKLPLLIIGKNSIYIMNCAWDSFSEACIANCFRRAGFVILAFSLTMQEVQTVECPTPPGMTSAEFEGFIHFDDDLDAHQEVQDGKFCTASQDSASNDEHNEEHAAAPIPSTVEAARACMNKIRVYFCS
uniref:HTH CENPB-type domain-containing protein n=1 Tax=Latimeria chalumnae TaxID=7897 RepID=H2ZVN5_LATCH